MRFNTKYLMLILFISSAAIGVEEVCYDATKNPNGTWTYQCTNGPKTVNPKDPYLDLYGYGYVAPSGNCYVMEKGGWVPNQDCSSEAN